MPQINLFNSTAICHWYRPWEKLTNQNPAPNWNWKQSPGTVSAKGYNKLRRNKYNEESISIDLWFNLGQLYGEVDWSSGAWDWLAASWNAPSNTISLPSIEFQVFSGDMVDTVEPILFVDPRLKPGKCTEWWAAERSIEMKECFKWDTKTSPT